MESLQVPIQDRICVELEEKNRILNEYVHDREKNNDVEGVIQIRVHQLALCKVLVNIHQRDQFFLIQSHACLGECYLKFNYIEQGLQHLIKALKLNGTIMQMNIEAKKFHGQILTQLGKCYLESGNSEEALKLLERAIQNNEINYGEDHIVNSTPLAILSQVYIKRREYQHSLECLTKMMLIHQHHYGEKHESLIKVYIDIAKVYSLLDDYNNAIEYQTKAYNNLIELDVQPELAGETAITLSQYYIKLNQIQDAIDVLKQAEDIYQFIYGKYDKFTAKAKRKYCMLMLKQGEYERALEKCVELDEVEKQLYGETSTHYAKTLKIIGTINLILYRYNEATQYFSQALQIAQSNKNNSKLVQEIKSKLSAIDSHMSSNTNIS